MAFPQFLCIGARKSATTWLDENLAQHPELWLPPVKEVHYLDHEPPSLLARLTFRTAHLRNMRRHLHASFRESPEARRWALHATLGARDDAWYAGLFPEIEGVRCGEVCPGYAKMSQAQIAHAHEIMPDARIIYLLRDPIECAWSSATSHFAKKKGRLGVEGAPEAKIKAYLSSAHARAHLDYAANLRRWMACYPEEQILIVFFDEILEDSVAAFRKVCSFLGVDTSDRSLPETVTKRRWGQVVDRAEIPDAYFRFLAELHRAPIADIDTMLGSPFTAAWRARVEAAS